jgi:hypothetical protein
MTIDTDLARVQYNGNGVTTAFTFNSRILDKSHLRVIRKITATGAETTLILDSGGADGYTVAGVGGSSCTVNTVAAPATGTTLTIARNTPVTQTADYVENDPFPAETHESALDKLTILIQQLAGVDARTLKFAETASTSLTPVLTEAPVDGLTLAWSGVGGDVVNGPSVADIGDAAANAATASAAAAAAAASAASNGGMPWVVAGGTADAITVTYSPAIDTPLDGQIFAVRVTAANATTTPTFKVGTSTARTIVKKGGAALAAGDIPGALAECLLRYNLANTRYELLNPATAGKLTYYQVTDSTDVTLSQAPTQANVGSAVTMVIPTKGLIQLQFIGSLLTTTAASDIIVGIRIGSTNYWPSFTRAGGSTEYWDTGYNDASATAGVYPSYGTGARSSPAGVTGMSPVGLSIEKLSIPTGSQTVQLIAAKSNANALVIKGTVVQTLMHVAISDYT